MLLTLLVLPLVAHAEDTNKRRSPTVAATIMAGDCEAAVAEATKALDAQPKDPWRAWDLGDAWRCSGENISALSAYRIAVEALPAEPSLIRIIKTLSRTTARLDLTLTGIDLERPSPWLAVVSGDQRLHDFSAESPVFHFRDLPAGVPLTLEVAGPGVSAISVELGELEADTTAVRTQQIDQGEPATLVLEPWTAASRVEVIDHAFHKAVEPGLIYVTPGTVMLSITTGRGTITEQVKAPLGVTPSVDIDTLVPGTLELVGLAAGTEVRWPTGPDTEGHREVAEERAPLHPILGLPMAQVEEIEDVRSGQRALSFHHPLLGDLDKTIVVVGGEKNVVRVDSTKFSEAPALIEAYSSWKAEDARRNQSSAVRRRSTVYGVLTVVPAVVVLSGAATWLTAIQNEHGGWSNYLDSVDEGAQRDAYDTYDDVIGSRRSRTIGAIITGVGLVGGGVTVGVSLGAHHLARLLREERPWDPASALAPTPTEAP